MELRFLSELYSGDAIMKAAYLVAAEASVDISQGEGHWICRLNFFSNIDREKYADVAENFRVEVLDQALREKISKETEAVRNVILAAAFSKIG